MRGLAALMIINAIMKELTAKAGGSTAPFPCQVFDLICGTSVGGVISILLGRLGLDCETAISIYEMASKKLFSKERDIWSVIADGQFLITSKFNTYVAQKIGEFTGSPGASMRPSHEDPDSHTGTKVLWSKYLYIASDNSDIFVIDIHYSDGRCSQLHSCDRFVRQAIILGLHFWPTVRRRCHKSNFSVTVVHFSHESQNRPRQDVQLVRRRVRWLQ